MDARKIRGLFNQVRRTAARFAERCDFVAAEEIKNAKASCSKDTAYVSALYKDPVERVQIITSYTYASGLRGLNFFTSADEDGPAEHGKRYMILTLSLENRRRQRVQGGAVMKKDLVWQAVDVRRGRTSCRPAAEIRRRCEITHGILRKRLNAKVIIEHGTTKVEVK